MTHAHYDKPAIRAYLGGSFDPVHQGHVQIAMGVYQRLLPIAKQQNRALHVTLLPTARSPFKDKSTDPIHRLAMLKLATQESPIQIGELELWQTPPVYTIDSMRTLRQRYRYDQLIFIMGMDSAQTLDRWKTGLGLTDYVNLWVFDREDLANINGHNPTIPLPHPNVMDKNKTPKNISVLPLPHQLQPLLVHTPTQLTQPSPHASTHGDERIDAYQGRIYIDPRPVAAISSTKIRQQLQTCPHSLMITPTADTQIISLPPINDIMGHTEPDPLIKWLNPAVYQYIIAHQLYSAAQFR